MSEPPASVGSAVGFAPMPTGTGWERTPWEALRKADSSGGRMGHHRTPAGTRKVSGAALHLGRGQEYERARPATG
jgi:hypothetical protein